MIIHSIEEMDKFSVELKGKVTKALCRGAYQVRDTARKILLNSVPNANKQSSLFQDTLVDGIQVGKLRGDTIKVHTMGTSAKGSGTFRTKFFIGGTNERFTKGGHRHFTFGTGYVIYKKPASKGRITANDALAQALAQESNNIHNNFKNIE